MFADETFIGAVATIVVGLLGLLQWYISARTTARTRDHDLYAWGCSVIDLMTTLEMLATETVRAEFEPSYRQRCRELMAEASALIDKGRLFFPNVQTASFSVQGPRPSNRVRTNDPRRASRGFRVRILDEVIRAFMVAKFLNANGPQVDNLVRYKLRESRRRFLSFLQVEMGQSLKRSSRRETGGPVGDDPREWAD
jgi:hypothetical protein